MKHLRCSLRRPSAIAGKETREQGALLALREGALSLLGILRPLAEQRDAGNDRDHPDADDDGERVVPEDDAVSVVKNVPTPPQIP